MPWQPEANRSLVPVYFRTPVAHRKEAARSDSLSDLVWLARRAPGATLLWLAPRETIPLVPGYRRIACAPSGCEALQESAARAAAEHRARLLRADSGRND